METFRCISGVRKISQSQWNGLLTHPTPFIDHRFLAALEDTACVSDRTGWLPSHVVMEEDGKLCAAIPMYSKMHSYGEYVFDMTWADAYHQHGLSYYPKLLTAIPFTPVNGPRFLGDNKYHPALFQHVISSAMMADASGWHINYPDTRHSLELFNQYHFYQRQQCQFQWFNHDYTSFENFLSHFTSRKRKTVNKERRQLQQQGVVVNRICGEHITEEQLSFFYRCYQTTHFKRGSSPYLTQDFFRQILQTMPEHLLLVVAQQSDVNVAAALCFHDQDTLYGRYWGATREIPGLHFEVCYYQGIEFCIEHGLKVFDPGTQGEHKISRGFEPVISTSFHRLNHPEFHRAVGRFCDEESAYIKQYQSDAKKLLPFNQQWSEKFTNK